MIKFGIKTKKEDIYNDCFRIIIFNKPLISLVESKKDEVSHHSLLNVFFPVLLMYSVFQGYYDNPKVCALYVMKGTLEGESWDCKHTL